ncbi:MAG: SH3 domain-containing protein, partial [Anaerolineae bacterium]|nr:SH3 domain-containing protein [Anaerolineae bacterium]
AATLSARDTATAFAQGVIATVNAVNTQSAAPKATLAVQQTRTAIQATIDAVQTVARATVNAQLTAVAATAFARPTSTNTPFIPTSVFGATVTPYGFASPTPVNCPGFLPSRLSIGQTARVTPGDPNRLRQTPGTGSAHPVVTQVPGGGVIRVLEGPVCTVESGGGVAWWRVEWYDASAGRTYTGWTAEGMGTTYWVEPWTP